MRGYSSYGEYCTFKTGEWAGLVPSCFAWQGQIGQAETGTMVLVQVTYKMHKLESLKGWLTAEWLALLV